MPSYPWEPCRQERFSQSARQDPSISALFDAFERAAGGLSRVVSSVRDSSQNMSGASDKMLQASEELRQSVLQINELVAHLAKGATSQTSCVEDAARQVQGLLSMISEIAKGASTQSISASSTYQNIETISKALSLNTQSILSVADNSKKASDSAQGGGMAINKTIDSISRIKVMVQSSVEKVENLSRFSRQIGMIVKVISDIAEQTNLLALNAAIEAVRAGEHGRGFAVVASEIRKLAERSGEATEEISSLIASVQEEIEKVVKAMEEGSREVEEVSRGGGEAQTSLMEIINNMSMTFVQIQEIAQAMQGMNTNTKELVRATEEVANISEENASMCEEMAANSQIVENSIKMIASMSQEFSSISQEIAASTEQQANRIEGILSTVAALSQQAHALRELVDKFKTEETATLSLSRVEPPITLQKVRS
ncbi:MAG: methyl-accepting chemotaxis protein [Armatimonadetes bacterium]|nr:methyl-accepting chemotaxis protein [Armatimonadota bacterium]